MLSLPVFEQIDNIELKKISIDNTGIRCAGQECSIIPIM